MFFLVMGNGEKNEEVVIEGIGVKEEKKLGKKCVWFNRDIGRGMW